MGERERERYLSLFLPIFFQSGHTSYYYIALVNFFNGFELFFCTGRELQKKNRCCCVFCTCLVLQGVKKNYGLARRGEKDIDDLFVIFDGISHKKGAIFLLLIMVQRFHGISPESDIKFASDIYGQRAVTKKGDNNFTLGNETKKNKTEVKNFNV